MARATTTRTAPERDTVPRFEVCVLGTFSVRCAGEPLDVGTWPRRGRSLLRLLATTPDHRRPRDEVVDLLWPEATPEAGASDLRSSLHRVRRVLGPAVPAPMILVSGWLSLNPDCMWEIDLEHFEELVAVAGDDPTLLQEAAELAAGEVLVEDRYEDWSAPVREQVARQWRAVCLRLARLQRVWGSRAEALRWFERVLRQDPLDEEALQGLLAALGEAGLGSEALRRYQQFAQRLEAELEVPPAPETVALAAGLRVELEQGRAEPVAAAPSTVVLSYPLPTPGTLVGQAAALDTLLAALAAADSGASTLPQLLLLAGEAGMGKTCLLAEMARKAQDAGMLVLAGGCYEQEGRLPYGPIHDALLDYVRAQPDEVLRSVLAELPDVARILPEGGTRLPEAPETRTGDPESQRLRLFSAVAQFLERIMTAQPLVLLLDDLQWADEATLQLLHYLLRQTRLSRLLVVGAYREEEVARGTPLEQLLLAVDGTHTVQQVQIRLLSDGDLAQLLADRLGAPADEPLVRALHDRSAGNPFFALQMLELLQAEGGIVRHEESWRLEPSVSLDLPPAVREAIARRLRRLGEDEREALTLGAVLGREFAYPALAALWEGAERSLFAALDAAEEVHLVGEREEGYAFQHPLLWEAVYGEVPAARQAVLHERAGLALERLYGSRAEDHAAELAYQFGRAGQNYGERTVRYLTTAGDAAMHAYAWSEACESYSHALARAADGTLTPGLQERLGVVLRNMARYEEALETLGQAAQTYHAAADLESLARVMVEVGHVHVARGTISEGLARIQPLVEILEERGSSDSLASVYVALANLFFMAGHYADSVRLAESASAMAQETGNDLIFVSAESVRGMDLMIVGDAGDGRRVLEDVLPLIRAVNDFENLRTVLTGLGGYYYLRGVWERAIAHYEHLVALSERMGERGWISFALAMLGAICFQVGDWEQAHEYFRCAGNVEDSSASSFLAYTRWAQGMLHLAEGKREKASALLGEAVALAENMGNIQVVRFAQIQLAEWDLLDGCPAKARARLQPLLDRGGIEEQSTTLLLPSLACAHLSLGDDSAAEEVVTDAVRRAIAQEKQPTLVDARRIQGMLAVRRRNWEEARRVFDEGLSLARGMPYPYGEARLLHEYGLMHAQSGDLEQARRRVNEALVVFRRLGALPSAERAEQTLAQLNAGCHPRPSRQRAR